MTKRDTDLNLLFPPFAETIQKVQEELKQYNFYIFETYRSYERQEELYKKGREKINGVWKIIDKSKIVTNARPGLSWHAYGLAVDFVPDSNIEKEGIQWNWEDVDTSSVGKGIQPIPWNELGKIALKCGLEWAGYWEKFQEMPHVQNRYGLEIHQALEILENEGIKKVWEAIKIESPKKPMIVNLVPEEKEVVIKNTIVIEESSFVSNKLEISRDPETKKNVIKLIFELIMSLFKKWSKKSS